GPVDQRAARDRKRRDGFGVDDDGRHRGPDGDGSDDDEQSEVADQAPAASVAASANAGIRARANVRSVGRPPALLSSTYSAPASRSACIMRATSSGPP